MATIILYNGSIYTLDPTLPRAQAIALRDGRVLAVGSEGKVQAAAGGRAEGINLRGRAVVPALTDAHVHLTWYALGRREVRLDAISDYQEAVLRAAEAAAALPDDGSWLIGAGWDHSRWGGHWPTATDLDALIPNRPVLLARKDGHSAWVNSRALELAGITSETPDPPGGALKREKGQLTGILLENAIDLVRRHIPVANQGQRLAALREVMAEAHSYGMAGVQIPPGLVPGDGAQTLRDLQLLREAGQLKLRCLAHIGLDGLDAALQLGLRSGLGDDWIRLGGLKLFSDGSLGSETAEMLSHYEGRRHLGTATMATSELNEAVQRAISSGISVIIHAIGDAANRRVLDAIELAISQHPPTDSQPPTTADDSLVAGIPTSAAYKLPTVLPNRIEHCQVLHPSDIPRFARLGVVASMQPIHATADMETAERLWGERCANAYAWRTLKESGAILAFGSDAPVEPLNPWLGVHAAVTRQRPDGSPGGGWRAEQCLSVADAIWGFTAGAAYAAGSSNQGTLMPGKLADLAILSADPFKIAPGELHAIRAECTIIDGQIVWEK